MPTEIWKDIAGYEGLYQVSNFGRVRSLDRMIKIKGKFQGAPKSGERPLKGRILKQTRCPHTLYTGVILCRKSQKRCLVHRLVAKAFVPNPNNLPVVNHIDGNRFNNKASNLEWCTQSENVLHAIHSLERLGHSFPPKKVKCVETGEVFVSMNRAAKAYSSNPGNIWRSATSGRYKASGYHWTFV